jgi:hypothetical protein
MLLCLSSGARQRYLEDIVRATSMPPGSRLRFRYRTRHVSPDLSEQLAENLLGAQDICVSYFDMADPDREPEIVPCRKAQLIASKRVGDILILDMELSEFWVAHNLPKLNEEVRHLSSRIPKWQAGKISGSFCEQLDSIPDSLRLTADIGVWQGLTSDLGARSSFADIQFFYMLQGLYRIGSPTPITQRDGAYVLTAESSYEIRLVQFSPRPDRDSGPEAGWIVAESEDNNISFITNKKLAVDSPYDEKFVRFRTSTVFQEVDSLISIFRQNSGSVSKTVAPSADKGSAPVWEFDLLFTIRPRHLALIAQGALVGVLIALQGLVVIWSNERIAEKIVPAVLVLLAGVLTGVAASYKLRRP